MGMFGLVGLRTDLQAQTGEVAPRPNIILILADDLGYGDLGCYGQQKIKTPNLDRLASEGMTFTQFYAGSTVCAPSRCVLMTGKHTGHARIRGNGKGQYPLQPQDVTVAELLQSASYRTCALGKWGLGDDGSTGAPRQKGFHEFFGYLTHGHAHDYYPDFLWRNEGKINFDVNRNGGRGNYAHDLFPPAAVNFVRINRPDHQFPDRRFFIYLSVTIPHANNELGRETGNGMEVPDDAPYSQESWPQPEKNKAAMITRLDRDVGRLLDELKKLKADDNTLILFTSDNGPHREGGVDPKFFKSAGPLRGIKRDLYEGGIRVPMIARWPGKIPAGVTNDFAWSFADVLPTLAELGGAQLPPGLDGRSVMPTLLGQQQDALPYLYWEFHERGFQQALRTGDWKLLQTGQDKAYELYDLKADPGETVDLAAKHPEVVGQLSALLKSARTESDQWPVETAGKKAKTSKK